MGLKHPFWRILDRISRDLYVLCCTQNSHVRYAPLYIHSFVLCAPRKILEATQFNQRYHRYEEIESVPDRLRWLRHSRGWMQSDVCRKIGMSDNVYKNIEEGYTQHIPIETMQVLAQLYSVSMMDFMDEFNRFLYDGQAERIQAYRKNMGLGRKPFARATGIPIRCLQEWESGRKTVSRKSWEKYFRGKA